jgi:hypothetical protein
MSTTDQNQPSQIPPASFSFLVATLAAQAATALGLAPDPDGKTETNLELAKHFIDTLGLLEEKTKGNLTADEAALLTQSTTQLRMAYVGVQKGK